MYISPCFFDEFQVQHLYRMFYDLCLINTSLHTVTQEQQRCSNMSKGLLDAVVFKILPLYR